MANQAHNCPYATVSILAAWLPLFVASSFGSEESQTSEQQLPDVGTSGALVDSNTPANTGLSRFFKITQPIDYSDKALRAALLRKLSSEEVSVVVNPLLGSPAISKWAKVLTSGATNELQTARRIYDALSRRVIREPSQPSSRLRTAADVLADWNAPEVYFSCQDFGFVGVAAARAAGLKAYVAFVEEDCYGAWNFHACPGFIFGKKALLADPLYAWFGAPHKKFILLDDLHAVALYTCGKNGLTARRAAYKLAPDLPPVLSNLFRNLTAENEWKEAAKLAQDMAHKDPGAPMTLCAQAIMSDRSGSPPEQGIELALKATEKAPHMSLPYLVLGREYTRQGKFEEATNAYQNAAQWALTAGEAQRARGAMSSLAAYDYCFRGYAQASGGDLNGALTNYQRAIEVSPEYADAYLGRGQVEQQKGDLDHALADFSTAIKLQSDFADAYYYRSAVRHARGDSEGALSDYKRALQLNPGLSSQTNSSSFDRKVPQKR